MKAMVIGTGYKIRLGLGFLALSCLLQSGIYAGVIKSTLLGDPRLGNPDNLIVDVTVNFTGNVASWIVDINSPLHPKVKLDQLGFNIVAAVGTTYSIGNFQPNNGNGADWEFATNAKLAGSGNMLFRFINGLGKKGSPKDNEVNNSVNLTFDLTRSSGVWAASDFLNAPTSTSKDAGLGSGQLGAHLQSLTALRGQSDSGVALGGYFEPRAPLAPLGPATVPEPSTVTIFLLLGGAGLVCCRFRKNLA
jgi:hypothetical protein